ncbi:MAG: hypothetical protein WBB47_08760, partial [Paenisporosarcina sp.]
KMKKEHTTDHSSHSVAHQQSDYFHIPHRCCPDQFPSPTYPSAADCLPPDMLEQVVEKIRDANELLLNLALDDNRPQHETYQKMFDGLVGIRVEITNLLGETTEGKITLVGFDFVVLREEEMNIMFPFSEIDSIKPFGRYAEPYHDPELTKIDPCFRRDLTFHFGEVVSSSPELIQLFFRIRLSVYLLLFQEKRILVKTDGLTREGLLTEVNKESITLKVEEESTIFPLAMIRLITMTA